MGGNVDPSLSSARWAEQSLGTFVPDANHTLWVGDDDRGRIIHRTRRKFRWSAGSDHCAGATDRWYIGIHDVADLREAGVACRKSRVHGVDRIDSGGVPRIAVEERQVGAPSLGT